MIEYCHGDILEDPAEALVNTVNCVGVMGQGITRPADPGRTAEDPPRTEPTS